MIAVGNDRQFAACVCCCGLPQLAQDARFRHNQDRLQNRDALVTLMTQALRKGSCEHWIAELADAGVPCSPINDLGQVFSGGYAEESELVHTLEHPYSDKLPTVANPIRFSASPVDYGRAPPLLGEHTGEVLADWLGYSDEAVDQLKRAGTV